MPEGRDEIHPFLTSIGTGGAIEQSIDLREHGIQQGNQVVFQHGLHLGILLVVPVAVSKVAGYLPPGHT